LLKSTRLAQLRDTGDIDSYRLPIFSREKDTWESRVKTFAFEVQCLSLWPRALAAASTEVTEVAARAPTAARRAPRRPAPGDAASRVQCAHAQ
jgi:hypothetical protein